MHLNVKPFKCSFPGCSKSFTFKFAKTRHEENIHGIGMATALCKSRTGWSGSPASSDGGEATSGPSSPSHSREGSVAPGGDTLEPRLPGDSAPQGRRDAQKAAFGNELMILAQAVLQSESAGAGWSGSRECVR